MFMLEGRVCWSASDLTAAAQCEYAVLRTLDYRLGWASRIEFAEDPLQEHIARLGDDHEAELLATLRVGKSVIELAHISSAYTMAALEAARDATLTAFNAEPEVVYQAAFFDGEFFGYADFVERAEDGWLVCDAKLARQAKPTALIQLGAYAEQIRKLGLPLSSTVSLLLGNDERADFRVADVLPVFQERRDRFRSLVSAHRAGGAPVAWGDDSVVSCGRCAECKHAASENDDLILVAGLRSEQRLKLRAAGITTIAELAGSASPPDGIAKATYTKLRTQASLQWRQMRAGESAPLEYELAPTGADTLALLPEPSEGDLFFDFEGDPLYDEGDRSRIGLEYLWGLMGPDEEYVGLWAHNSSEERDALVEFVAFVAERRERFPDLHIYHYAPYETTALKRLTMRYQTKEKELDDLLRSEVFVDLYATVRGSVRVAAPSYSIKQLEPLYMGEELRSSEDDAVSDGGASVVAYHQYRSLREVDPDNAAARLAALEDYNTYDCLSTLRLRDWLLERAEEAGARGRIAPRALKVEGEELSVKDPVFMDLMAKSGPEQRNERTDEQQAFAMLATAIDYNRRERKQFWWDHFERLQHPVEEWANTRDVFVVESAELVQDWTVPEGKAKNARRVLRLVGDWAPGSKAGTKESDEPQIVYAKPTSAPVKGPEGAPYGAGGIEKFAVDTADPRVVMLTESRKPAETYADRPVALVPAMPPGTKDIDAAIKELGAKAASATSLPGHAALDVLARRKPRLRDGGSLPTADSTVESVVAALLAMDDSYVAIQGPPGTGKTYNGSRVIKELVEKHHWRIGVVAQSHAVVENMFGAIVKAGLDPALVGKNSVEANAPTWTVLDKGVTPRADFLDEHEDTGCVLGGTAWTFANDNLIERCGLDLLVVDEAGQFSLAPTLGVSVAAKRLLLLGDPQQLPQVSHGTHAEPVDDSALGWLMDGHDTIPTDLGYFLGESFRMHPSLCERVSVLSYEGRLHSAAKASARSLEGIDPGLHVVTLDHTGNRTESPEEAAEVVAQVQASLGKLWTDPEHSDTPRPLVPTDFLVVAPYNAQVGLIRRALDKAGLAGVQVGTVDKFQGREAPIAIVSMTASSHGDVPRGMGFLLNRDRVNVAVSRAQWRAIVIRSEGLTAFMPRSANGVLELGAFIGLCQPVAE